MAEISSVKARAAQVRPLQLGPLKTCVAQVGVHQISILEVATLAAPLIEGLNECFGISGPDWNGGSTQADDSQHGCHGQPVVLWHRVRCINGGPVVQDLRQLVDQAGGCACSS
jgi:hypothetical protein